MKYIKEAITSWQFELGAQMLNASHGQKHGNRRTKSEEIRRLEIQLWILDQWLAGSGETIIKILNRARVRFLATSRRSLQIGQDLLLDFFAFFSKQIILDLIHKGFSRPERKSNLHQIGLIH